MVGRSACVVASVCLLQFVLADSRSTCAEEPHSDTEDIDTLEESLEDLLLLQVGLQLQSPYRGSNFTAQGDVAGALQPRIATSVAQRLLAALPQQIVSTNTTPEDTIIVFSSHHPAVLDSSLQQSIIIHGRQMLQSRITAAALVLLLIAFIGLLFFCSTGKPSFLALHSEPQSREHDVKATEADSGAEHGSLLSCYFVVFVDAFGFGIYAPLVPVMRKTFALTAQDIAALLAAYSLLQAINTPVLGFLSDRFGRRSMIMLALAAEVLAWFLLSNASSYGGLLVGYSMAGAASATIGVSNAYIADASSEEEKPIRLSYSSGSIALGLMLGPLTGALLSGQGFVATVRFCSFLSALNLLFVYCFMSEFKSHASESKNSEEEGSTLPRLACLLCWVSFFGHAGVAANETCGALFMMDSFFAGNARESTQFYALTMSTSGIVNLVSSVVVVPLMMQLLKQYSTMLIGGTVRMIGYVGMANAPTKWWFLNAYFLVNLGDALAGPNVTALLTEVVGKSNYGAALGTMAAFEAVARVLDPFLFAHIYERISHGSPYIAVASLGAAGLALWVSVFHAHYRNGQVQKPQ